MKYIKFLLLFFIFNNCQAQEKTLIIKQQLITDFSKARIYPKIIQEVEGTVQWKPYYKYLDAINIYDITYLSDGLKVKGYLIKPKKEGNYPCIIYNRGGNRNFGALNLTKAIYRLGQLAKEGYVIIASQYRGNSGGEGQEEFGGKDVNDVTNLINVIKEITEVDSTRIGMYGWSRGGMMTYLALTKTDKIKAAVVGGAPSDKTTIDRPEMETGVYAELIPNYWKNKDAELRKRSAVYFADKFPKNVPILMLHGNADWRVKPEHSLKLALEFEKHRIPYKLIMFEGADHGINEHWKEVDEQVFEWFDKYLKKGKELPNMEYHGR
jgi:dipeptidyl aminopeptidase/acylaminoacyl peptidase